MLFCQQARVEGKWLRENFNEIFIYSYYEGNELKPRGQPLLRKGLAWVPSLWQAGTLRSAPPPQKRPGTLQVSSPRRTYCALPGRPCPPGAQDQHDAHQHGKEADQQENEVNAEVGAEEDGEARKNGQDPDEAEQQAAPANLQEEADSLEQQPEGDDREQQAVVCARENQAEHASDNTDDSLQEKDRAAPDLRTPAAEDGAAQRSQAIDDRIDAKDVQKEEQSQFWPEEGQDAKGQRAQALEHHPPVTLPCPGPPGLRRRCAADARSSSHGQTLPRNERAPCYLLLPVPASRRNALDLVASHQAGEEMTRPQ